MKKMKGVQNEKWVRNDFVRMKKRRKNKKITF